MFTTLNASLEPAALLVYCRRVSGRTIHCACQKRSWSTERQSSILSSMVLKSGFCTRNKCSYYSAFINSVFDPSFTSVTNKENQEQANTPSIEAMLLTRQPRWAGHLSCMEDTLMPKAVFFGELCQGKQGSPPEMLQGSVMTTAKCNEEKGGLGKRCQGQRQL